MRLAKVFTRLSEMTGNLGSGMELGTATIVAKTRTGKCPVCPPSSKQSTVFFTFCVLVFSLGARPVAPQSAADTAKLQKTNIEQRRLNPSKTPRQVIEEFVKMEFEGKRLTAQGREELKSLFVQAYEFSRVEKVEVLKDVGVGEETIVHDNIRTEVGTGALLLGEIDLNTAILQLVPSAVKLLNNYELVLTDKHGLPLSKEEATHETENPPEWRISGIYPRPQISVRAAIEYVTKIRDSATSRVTKINANQTLLKLKALK
jgi:hypothetical protein